MWSVLTAAALTLRDCLPDITVVLVFCTALINFMAAVLVLVHRLRRRPRGGRSH
jgi:hypothetical protein